MQSRYLVDHVNMVLYSVYHIICLPYHMSESRVLQVVVVDGGMLTRPGGVGEAWTPGDKPRR